jgi:16S rRNA (uracil1498-N3)-methyltransferase
LCYHRYVLRRVHVPALKVGEITLDAAASRHARDVLRLGEGTEVEAFDDAGAVATGVITKLSPQVLVRIETIDAPSPGQFELTIAAAVPKGERADWMVEKLSELGCACFIPLATERSVVLPEGRNKRERWLRIATESAKQSRRRGVMRIEELTKLSELLQRDDRMICLSTEPKVPSLVTALRADTVSQLTLLIGPEGGWTDAEIAVFAAKKVSGNGLTTTVLRLETAAIAAASVVMTLAAEAGTSNRDASP